MLKPVWAPLQLECDAALSLISLGLRVVPGLLCEALFFIGHALLGYTRIAKDRVAAYVVDSPGKGT